MAGSGELFKRSDGKWSFLVKAGTGEAVANDAVDGYADKAVARTTLQQLMRGEYDGCIVEEAPDTCGREITEDTVLDDDLMCTSGPALIVTADDITLDLNGHTISPTQGAGAGAGILLREVSGVTVRNGSVERFGAGIVIEGGSNNT
ncbi:MAG: hypothetical protein LC808_07095, partial [Actinobacteria bacterium]|nr:hypothetical protein [Actinomycetota bacterium]